MKTYTVKELHKILGKAIDNGKGNLVVLVPNNDEDTEGEYATLGGMSFDDFYGECAYFEQNYGEEEEKYWEEKVQSIVKREAKQWILKNYEEFTNDKTVKAIHPIGGRVCVFTADNNKIIAPPTFGYSDCNNADCFDYRIGTAIAYARYRHKEIPSFIYETDYTKGFLGD